VKRIVKKSRKKGAFTIIELLTVMSIIILLISLLAPAIMSVRRFARRVQQYSQFHGIDNGLTLYNAEQDDYPPSSDNGTGDYCGAMKLCEAMMGQDLLGFNPESDFQRDFDLNPGKYYWPTVISTADVRISHGPYLKAESSNASSVSDIYTSAVTAGITDPNDLHVLSDVYKSGSRPGMPILYYKAHPGRLLHDSTDPNNSIYNYYDNDLILSWGPADGVGTHNLTVTDFYDQTWNENIDVVLPRPHRIDSYILLSAGFDGIYGTGDDIYNFEKEE
jgi:type II secretory pathway pseudopilin PulG